MLWNALEVEQHLGRPLTTAETTRLHSTLGNTREAQLIAYLNRPVIGASFTETYAVLPGDLVLGRTPVLSVESITVDGTAVPADAYRVRGWGVELVGILPGPATVDSRLVVTYTAGLTDLDVDAITALRGVLHDRIARELRMTAAGAGPEVAQMAVEGTSIAYVGGVNGVPAWTDDELVILDRYRRRSFR